MKKTANRTGSDTSDYAVLPCLKEGGDGSLLLAVHVQPKASREAVCGLHGERLKIALTSPPVDGKANKALRLFVSSFLKTAKSNVELQSGLSSRKKIVKIQNLTYKEVVTRLENILST
ncbi:DUF167 family protein [Desulfopila sp. IMCC35008]|uniref:DUF167 domain-containing protein n=1 Tax=Desulfopila sp. IMCC35008 TaxID=2653858 RepID=UPI0013D10AE0|nr:DUF167 family protein [Desulfopila sp. IMCC35008]